MPSNRYAGVDNLLTPENHALLLIDHQALQLLTVGSHDPAKVVNNAAGLAKAAARQSGSQQGVARRSTAWTGSAGGGRVAPQGCPGATASGRAT